MKLELKYFIQCSSDSRFDCGANCIIPVQQTRMQTIACLKLSIQEMILKPTFDFEGDIHFQPFQNYGVIGGLSHGLLSGDAVSSIGAYMASGYTFFNNETPLQIYMRLTGGYSCQTKGLK